MNFAVASRFEYYCSKTEHVLRARHAAQLRTSLCDFELRTSLCFFGFEFQIYILLSIRQDDSVEPQHNVVSGATLLHLYFCIQKISPKGSEVMEDKHMRLLCRKKLHSPEWLRNNSEACTISCVSFPTIVANNTPKMVLANVCTDMEHICR